MDGAFTNLDDLSDREISERLESLFDSSLPSVSSKFLICFSLKFALKLRIGKYFEIVPQDV